MSEDRRRSIFMNGGRSDLLLSRVFLLTSFAAFLCGTNAAFAPPVYQVSTIPTGSPALWGPYQIFYNNTGDKMLIAEYRPRKFCSIKNGVRNYFAGSDTPYDATKAGIAGPATSAVFEYPDGIWADTMNNVFVADGTRGVRKVTPDGMIANYAGYGSVAGNGEGGGPATSASMVGAGYLTGDTNGNLFISEGFWYRLRKVSKSGMISIVAGGGTITTDGAPATSSAIGFPNGIFLNLDGDLFTISNNLGKVYKIDKATQTLTTICGGGSVVGTVGGTPSLSIAMSNPTGVWGDDRGNLFFAETGRHTVQMIAKESNYQTTYLVATAMTSAMGGVIDNPTGRLFVMQGNGVLKMLTDPLFVPLEATSAPVTTTSTPTANPSSVPSIKPSVAPSASPSSGPSVKPTTAPSVAPSASPSSGPSAKPTTAPSVAPSASPSSAPSVTPSAAPSEAPTLAVPEYSVTVSAKSFKYFEVRVFTEVNERVFPVSYNLVDCPENAGAVIWGHDYTPTTENTNTCVYGLSRHYWCECPALANGDKPKLTLNFGTTVFDRVELLILDWVDGEVVVSDSANNIVLFSASRAGGPLVGEEFVGYDHLNLLQIAPSVVPTVTPSSVPTTKPSWTPTTKPTIPSIVPTQTPTVVPSTTSPSAVPSVTPSMVPSAAPSFTAQYTITLTAKTFKYFEVRVYTHNNLRIFPVSYELEHCPENAGIAVWNDQTTEDTNTCVYGYPRNFWCQCAAVADAKPKLVLHMGHTVFDRVELLLLNWEDGEVTVTDEANHETFLSATHDGVGNEFVTFGNLNLEHAAVAPMRRLLRGA